MPELTPSTREATRRIGVTETTLRKAATKGRIEREADGHWDVEKTRRRMVETADPHRVQTVLQQHVTDLLTEAADRFDPPPIEDRTPHG